MVKRVEQIEELIAPALAMLDYDLWGCEMRQGETGGNVLRVYIDSPTGVNISDCTKASRHIGALLDIENTLNGNYTLEVSSPGVNRSIFTLVQMKTMIGRTIYVKLRSPVEGRRQWTGLLTRVDDELLQLVCDDDVKIDVSYANVDKAHVCADMD